MAKPIGERILHAILENPLSQSIISWSKAISFPGFFGVSLYDVVVFAGHELQEEDLITRANSAAYSFVLAIFPGIIFLFTLIAYTPWSDDFREVLHEYINSIMPGEAGRNVIETIDSVVGIQRGDLLSFGIILTMFFASNGIIAMMQGFNKSYKSTFKHRSWIKERVVAIQLVLILTFSIAVSMALVILGGKLIDIVYSYFYTDKAYRFNLQLLRHFSIVLITYSSISALYRYGAPTIRKFSWFSPGASLATVLTLLTSYLFSFYVDNYGRYNKFYGPIGTLMVVMIWIQLNTMVILIGYELNAAIAVNRDREASADEPDNTITQNDI